MCNVDCTESDSTFTCLHAILVNGHVVRAKKTHREQTAVKVTKQQGMNRTYCLLLRFLLFVKFDS